MLVSKIKHRSLEIKNSTEEERWWSNLIGSNRTNSGELVTPEQAMSNLSTVFACVAIRANALGKLPLHLFRNTDTGRERDKTHPLSHLLEKRPNKSQTPFQFWRYIEVCQLLWGNAYVLQLFDSRGKHKSLKILNPSRVTILFDDDKDEHFFAYTNEKGIKKTFKEEQMWHFPYISLDGKTGKAPLTVARENAGNLLAIQKFEGNFYKNGTMTQGILKTDQQLERDDKTIIQEQWALMNGGGMNAGKIPILDFGLEYKELTMPLKDAEFIMSKKMNQVEIANIFNVPIFMLNDTEKATFNNFEQMKLLFGENTLLPECIGIEQEINSKSFLTSENSYFAKFNLNSALRGDAKSRAEHYQTMMANAGYTPNEIRALEDLNPLDLPEADVPYMTRNLSPLTAIKDNATKGGANSEVFKD